MDNEHNKEDIQDLIDSEIRKLVFVGWEQKDPPKKEQDLRKLVLELVGEVHIECPDSIEKYQAMKCLKDASVWIRAAARKKS